MLIRNLVYILQIELYDTKKFLCFAYSHPTWWKLENRAKLVWTPKATSIGVFSIAFVAVTLLWAYVLGNVWALMAMLLVDIFLLPFFIAAAFLFLKPVDTYLKNKMIDQARKIINDNHDHLTIVGITGSYGKTSTREILATILGEKFKVIKLEENINTDVGVAEFITKNQKLFQEKSVFVVEMGAYKRGDIERLSSFIEPDFSILTGINESHLERFGNLKNTIRAKFELAEHTKKTTVLNWDDKNIRENCEKFKINEVIKVSSQKAADVRTIENFRGIAFEADGTNFRTSLLAKHNVTLILLAREIAKKLGLDDKEIARGVEKIKYIPHRLEPIYNSTTDVWVIDDSYNGNMDGIVSGMEVLERATGRRIILTPGLVELGEKTEEIHRDIGKLYAQKNVDFVMLVKNQATKHIIEGMEKMGFNRYTVYGSTKDAHDALSQVIRKGDTIIFQNDLPDNYF